MRSLQRPVLVVASEPETRNVLRHWLERRGVAVHEAGDLESAMRAIFRFANLGAVVCDERLDDGCAINFLHWMREQLFSVPFVLITNDESRGQPGSGFHSLLMPLSGAALHDALSRFVGLDPVEFSGS